LNRTTRSVSLTEAGEAYLSRIGPALGDVLNAAEELRAGDLHNIVCCAGLLHRKRIYHRAKGSTLNWWVVTGRLFADLTAKIHIHASDRWKSSSHIGL